MVNKRDASRKLERFGLTEKQVMIYLFLLEKGITTPLDIARKTEINRTTVYRKLEELQQLGLVVEVLDQHTTLYSASAPDRLEVLLQEKEKEYELLKRILPGLITELSVCSEHQIKPTQVSYYRGRSGLKQLLWNTLKAEGQSEVVGYGYGNWNDGVGARFAEKLRREFVERDVHSREILNEIKEYDTYTTVEGYGGVVYQSRRISETKLEIRHDTYIYNNVFAFYHIYNGELFGVEIHNAEIAKSQKQIFEILWELADER